MDQNTSTIDSVERMQDIFTRFMQKSGVKFLIGFLGWFLLTLPVVNYPDFLFGAYLTVNIVLLVILLLLKRLRLVGAGMASAMLVNFLVSIILGTHLSPRKLAPVIHPDVFQNRWNFHFHYLAKNIPPDLIEDCITQAPSAEQQVTSRPLSRIAYISVRQDSFDIFIINADGSGQERLTGIDYMLGSAWAPDGKKMALSTFRDENWDIYTMNIDGSDEQRLTDNPTFDMSPAWSPDGKQIAFVSNRDGNYEIYRMNVDGSAQTNLTRQPAQDSVPAWSPDGLQIAFESYLNDPQEPGIYLMNVDGTDIKRLAGSSETGVRPEWSPNSKCILYQSSRLISNWIMISKIDEAEPIKLIHAGSYPNWSPDGRWIVYTVVHGKWNEEIYTLDLNTMQTHRLTFNTFTDSQPVWVP